MIFCDISCLVVYHILRYFPLFYEILSCSSFDIDEYHIVSGYQEGYNAQVSTWVFLLRHSIQWFTMILIDFTIQGVLEPCPISRHPNISLYKLVIYSSILYDVIIYVCIYLYIHMYTILQHVTRDAKSRTLARQSQMKCLMSP